MPIDYSKYPSNWKTEIRPAVLEHAKNRCEKCNVENYDYVIRGIYDEKEAYHCADGSVYDASNGELLIEDLFCPISEKDAVKIVLTIAHLDHDITNNEMSNLKALCQKCHLNYDKEHHAKNRKRTIEKKKGFIKLDL